MPIKYEDWYVETNKIYGDSQNDTRDPTVYDPFNVLPAIQYLGEQRWSPSSDDVEHTFEEQYSFTNTPFKPMTKKKRKPQINISEDGQSESDEIETRRNARKVKKRKRHKNKNKFIMDEAEENTNDKSQIEDLVDTDSNDENMNNVEIQDGEQTKHNNASNESDYDDMSLAPEWNLPDRETNNDSIDVTTETLNSTMENVEKQKTEILKRFLSHDEKLTTSEKKKMKKAIKIIHLDNETMNEQFQKERHEELCRNHMKITEDHEFPYEYWEKADIISILHNKEQKEFVSYRKVISFFITMFGTTMKERSILKSNLKVLLILLSEKFINSTQYNINDKYLCDGTSAMSHSRWKKLIDLLREEQENENPKNTFALLREFERLETKENVWSFTYPPLDYYKFNDKKETTKFHGERKVFIEEIIL